MFADYAKYYQLFNSDKPYEKEIAFVYNWAERPKSIFDIGPGTCHYWKYYPKGVKIRGIEKSPHMPPKGLKVIKGDITAYKHEGYKFRCATALFDVINYIPVHNWWANIPVIKGGFFIFDIWDKEKVDRDGFRKTMKTFGTAMRMITPRGYDSQSVELDITVFENDMPVLTEVHKMYLYSHKNIEKFCRDEWEIVEVKPTERWQTWYKCKRR